MIPTTLKAKPETNGLLEIEDAPKKISKQPFRKYLRPSPILTLKEKAASLNEQKFYISNTTRKYFGRKTWHMSNFSQGYSIRNYYRYLRKVSFDEIVYWGSEFTPFWITIKSLGGLGGRDQSFLVTKTFVRRVITVGPCKVWMKLSENPSIEWLMSMPMHFKSNIKHLKIALSKKNHPELLETSNLFKNFNNLESCCICIIHDDFDGYYSEKPGPLRVDFLAALCKVKTMKSFELDLSQIAIARETLTMLLNEIDMHEPFRWYLKVRLYERRDYGESAIEIDNLKIILNKLDFLGLTASRTYVSEEYRDADVNGYEYNPTDDLSNLEHLTQKRKRILDISFPENSVSRLNLKPLFDNCISLKGIYIRSMGSCFEINRDIAGDIGIQNKTIRRDGDDSDQDESKDEHENNNDKDEYEHKEGNDEVKTWASNLEDVIFSFNDNTGYGDNAPDYLLPVLQKQSRNLRSLETFFCTSCDGYASDQRKEETIDLGRNDNIEMHASGLEQIISLEELKLASHGRDIHELEAVLRNLSSLKKFHLILGVGSKKQAAWDHSFPFKYCDNLQELKITINLDMKTLPWGKEFIKNCHYLQGLSVLEIHDQAKPIPLKTFCSLVKRLMDLKNIRRLIVLTKVESSFASEEVPEELEEHMKLSLIALLERLKAQVKSFVHSNRKLEELQIGKLKGLSFESIEYIGS